MVTITDFIRARLAEDEATALAAINVQEEIYPAPGFEVRYEWARKTRHVSGGYGAEFVPGAPSPARVLAVIAAKRAVVALCVGTGYVDDGPVPVGSAPPEAPLAWFTLAHMAAPYSSHPDYQQEWKP